MSNKTNKTDKTIQVIQQKQIQNKQENNKCTFDIHFCSLISKGKQLWISESLNLSKTLDSFLLYLLPLFGFFCDFFAQCHMNFCFATCFRGAMRLIINSCSNIYIFMLCLLSVNVSRTAFPWKKNENKEKKKLAKSQLKKKKKKCQTNQNFHRPLTLYLMSVYIYKNVWNVWNLTF